MAKSDRCAKRFQELRERIPSLATAGLVNPDFLLWHRDLLTAVGDCFGPKSAELNDIRSITFEPSPEAIDFFINSLSAIGANEFPMVAGGKASSRETKDPELLLDSLRNQHYTKTLDKVSALLDEYILTMKMRRPRRKADND